MIITSPQYNRPEFTKEMVNSLRNVRGISNCILNFSVDRQPDGKYCDEVLALLKEIDFAEKSISFAKSNLGCNHNARAVLYHGFTRENKVLHIEDDVLISPDTLELVNSVALTRQFRESFVLSLFNRLNKEEVNNENYTILKRPHFTCGAFVCTKKIFDKALDIDCFNKEEPYLSWGKRFNSLRARLGLYELFPKLSRSKNIGWYGAHVTSKEWFDREVALSYWAGDLNISSKKLIFEC